MDLNSLVIFDKVAEHASFSRAAKELKIPKSNVSLKIHQLEEDLGLKLFERSTRNVRITDYGEKVRILTQSLLEGVKEISALAEHVMADPKGVVKVSAPYDVGFFVLREVVPQFLKAYPDVSVQFDLSNRYVDLIHEGFDVALRASERALQDSSLVAVKLTSTAFKFFATTNSPEANIKTITELQKYPVVTYGGKDAKVSDGKKETIVKSNARIKVFDMLSAKQAVVGGLGVGFLPEFICAMDLESKSMVSILPKWKGQEASFHAVYPTRRLLPPKTRVFIEFLREFFESL